MSNPNKATTILVAGATGILGSEICRQLKEENKQVKGLVRSSSDSAKVASLRDLGVEIAVGDLKDKSSLTAALAGVDTVISTVTSTISRQEGDSIETVDDEGQVNLVSAAIDAGVTHFVFVSFCTMAGQCPLQDAKRKVEQLLVTSGMSYTILQPTFFMDIWLSPVLGFDYPNAKATIYGDGNKKVSWIALKDVASFAVQSLDNPAANNQFFELGGPDALSQLEVVDLFEKSQGRNFELQFFPEEAIRAQKSAAQDSLSESFAALMLSMAEGSEINMTGTSGKFSVSLTSVFDYANKTVIDHMLPHSG